MPLEPLSHQTHQLTTNVSALQTSTSLPASPTSRPITLLTSAEQYLPLPNSCSNQTLHQNSLPPEIDFSAHQPFCPPSTQAYSTARSWDSAILFPEFSQQPTTLRPPNDSGSSKANSAMGKQPKSKAITKKSPRPYRAVKSLRPAPRNRKKAKGKGDAFSDLNLNPADFVDVPLSFQDAVGLAGLCGIDELGLSQCLQALPPQQTSFLEGPLPHNAHLALAADTAGPSSTSDRSLLPLSPARPQVIADAPLDEACIQLDPDSSDVPGSDED